MKIDCFIFFQELDILELRLRYLWNHVDRFVICESDCTFTNLPKSWIFEDHLDRYRPYLSKIEYKKVISNQHSNPWLNEAFQRSQSISDQINEHDVVIASDIDEFPSLDLLEDVSWVASDKIYHLKQLMYYYNLRTRLVTEWHGTKITKYSTLKKQNRSLSDIRQTHHIPVNDYNVFVPNGGWHYSYFGTQDEIKKKIESFSHQEYNLAYIKNAIATNVKNQQDLFFRNEIQLMEVPITTEFHPNWIVQNLTDPLVCKFI